MTRFQRYRIPVLLIVLISIALSGVFGCNTKPTETQALDTKISGKVVDKDNNEALTDVQITTSPTTSSVSTDGSGNYTIPDVKAGQYIVSASKSGYTSNSITVLVSEGKTASADVKLETLKPAISISVASLDFGTSQTTANLIVSNATSIGTITYSIAKSVDWLTLSSSSGTVSTGNATITITASRTNLAYGNYNTIVSITSNAGNKDIPVTITVANPNAPQLTVSPLLLDFGQNISSLAFTIRNSGTSKLDWIASSSQPWITVQPASDSTRTETDMVTLTIHRNNLPPADYSGAIVINSNAGSQTVIVKMVVAATPSLSLSTTSLDFDVSQTQLSFTIANVGTGALNWSVASDQNWISVNPQSGTNSGTINISVKRDGLSQGSYSGTITIASNGGIATVAVTMKVVTSHASLAWKQVALPVNFQVQSMHYIAENNIWVAGYTTISGYNFPRIYQFNGSQWMQSDVQAQDSIATFRAIAFRSTTDGWAATNTGRIYKYDGTNWNIQGYLSNLYSIDEAIGTVTDIWFYGSKIVSGARPLIYRWNGSEFTELAPNTNSLNWNGLDMHFINATTGFCVDEDGFAYMFNGVGWIDLGNVGGGESWTISGTSKNDIWSSNGSYLYRYNGSTWIRQNDIGGAGISYPFSQIRMISPTEGWATGTDSPYGSYYFNGTSWTKVGTVSGKINEIKDFGNGNLWGIIYGLSGNVNKLMRLQ